jgi:hypothetical protein
MNLKNCRLIELPKIRDSRGNLSYIEGGVHIPFQVARVYYLYDIPGGADRGSHAHKNLHQLIIAVTGSFDVHLDDGRQKKVINLNRSHVGLYMVPMIWRYLDNFSSGAVCMVLASERFNEQDYLRDYSEFIEIVGLAK